MDLPALLERVESHVRRHELIPPGGDVLCLVSGGADSTCLWDALGALGYRVSALHVNHRLRGAESNADARFCREAMNAEVVEPPSNSLLQGESAWRELRYSFATDRLRATGRWAEAAGPVAVPSDRLARRLRFADAARADVAAMSEGTRAMFEAYAAGVNAFLDSGQPLPVEYGLTGLKPDRWESWHSVAGFKV